MTEFDRPFGGKSTYAGYDALSAPTLAALSRDREALALQRRNNIGEVTKPETITQFAVISELATAGMSDVVSSEVSKLAVQNGTEASKE